MKKICFFLLILALSSTVAFAAGFPVKDGVYRSSGKKIAPDGTQYINHTIWTISENVTKIHRAETINGVTTETEFYIDMQENGFYELYVKIPELGNIVIGNGMCIKDACHHQFTLQHLDTGEIELVEDSITSILGSIVVRKFGTSRQLNGDINVAYEELMVKVH